MTVFKRVPVFEPDEVDPLRIDEVLDFRPGIKPLQEIPFNEAVPLIQEELSEFLLEFVAARGRWPGAVANQALADANVLVEALEKILSAKGLVMLDREERTRLARAAASEASWHVNVCGLLGHFDEVARAGQERAELPSPTETHFVGAPRGDSCWVMADKPASKKANAHIQAELDRDGLSPARSDRRAVEFDGKILPAWGDVQKVLDDVAEHGVAGDVLTLTLDQLRRLAAQRC